MFERVKRLIGIFMKSRHVISMCCVICHAPALQSALKSLVPHLPADLDINVPAEIHQQVGKVVICLLNIDQKLICLLNIDLKLPEASRQEKL